MSKSEAKILEEVEDYYGKVLQSTKDLKTNACTTQGPPHPILRKAMAEIPLPVLERFYGCGSPIPLNLDGLSVLDLGSGSGRDCYLAAMLAGPNGKVTGIDMTDNQLEVARAHVDEFSKAQGFPKPTLHFVKGFIEDLIGAGIKEDSVDLVISNCVINLSPNKPRVLEQVYKVLRNGGEFYFSDVYCDRRLSEDLRNDPILFGECISGAQYTHDIVHFAKTAGFGEVRELKRTPLVINDPEIKERLGNAKFYSITYRMFKIAGLEPRCEDYGQIGIYNGTIKGHAHKYELDNGHVFETGRPMLICGNTALLLTQGVLCKGHFTVIGDTKTHYGIFPCNKGPLTSVSESSSAAGTCAPGSCAPGDACAPGGGCC